MAVSSFAGRLGTNRPGQVMVMAVIGLTVLLCLTVTLLSIAANLSGHSFRQVREGQALGAAEAACSRGITMLEQGAIASVPYTETAIPLGRRKMDLAVVAVGTTQGGGYEMEQYEVRGTGYSGTVRRTVALGGRHDSFLRYSRFLESGGVSYGAGARLSGQLYAGGNVTLAGSPVTFMDDLVTTGVVVNRSRGVYYKGVYEGAAPISLGTSMDVDHYRSLAQSNGMYFTEQATPPLIDLGLFDFTGAQPRYNGVDLASGFNGVVFCEGDIAVKGVLEGRSLTIVSGDDLIVADNVRTGNTKTTFAALGSPLQFDAAAGQETIQTTPLNSLMAGTADAAKMSVTGSTWQRLNLYLRQDGNTIGVATLERSSVASGPVDAATILSGLTLDPATHTYTAEVHYWSNGTGATPVQVEVSGGDPVNIGLLAKDYINISQYAPRVLTIDAGLFARDSNWRPIDDSDGYDSDNSHPKCHGVWDLDQDGQIESPNEDGWDEANVGNDTWMLNTNGPIITKNGGSAGAWEYQGSIQGKVSRHYYYDTDIVHYEPPQFPVMLSRWAVLYWREA